MGAEVERDNKSDRSNLARCSCRTALPDAEIKKELWDKFINQPHSDSLYKMKAYMQYFVSIDQLEMVEEYLRLKFVEDVKKIGTQEYFYIGAFTVYLAPYYYANPEMIGKINKLVEETKDMTNLNRNLKELVDDMTRFTRAQAKAEFYLSLL